LTHILFFLFDELDCQHQCNQLSRKVRLRNYLLYAEWNKQLSSPTTLCPKKRSHFYFLNNSVKNEPILTIFGTRNPEGT